MLVMSNLQQHYMIRKLANKSLMPMIEALGIKRKNFDDKALPLCYNQLKALYFCKRHHMTVFYRCTPLWRGQTTSHYSTKDMEVFDALITNQQQENWNAVCRQNAENVVKRRMNCIPCVNIKEEQHRYTL